MARAPTTFSRVSTGYKDSKNTIAEAGYDLSCIDLYVAGATTHAGGITGTTGKFTSTLSADGAATFQSTVSSRAVGTFTGLFNRSNLTQSSNATFGAGVTIDSLATLNSNVTIKGGLTVDSNATLNSNVTIKGGLTVQSGSTFNSHTYFTSGLSSAGYVNGVTGAFFSSVTASGGLSVGGGQQIGAISTVTAAISLGAITPLESSSIVTCAFSGLTRGDTLILTLDANYARAAGNTDIAWFASSGSTSGEACVWGINSTLTSVTPTAGTIIRLTKLSHANYL